MRTVCCEHCGMPKRPREPVQECWVVGEQHLLHRGCQVAWLAAPAMQLPSGSKVFGIAPGHRCERCGSGRDVYFIQLPGEEEAADRHKECAGRYWRKKREIPPTALHGTRGGMTTAVISVPRSGSDLDVKSLSSAAIGANVAGM